MKQDEKTRVGHCKKDSFDVYIGRGDDVHLNSGTLADFGWLGNPYRIDEHGRSKSIELYELDFSERLGNDEVFRQRIIELSGKTLGCWCRKVEDDEPRCHGDVIVHYADKLAEREKP